MRTLWIFLGCFLVFGQAHADWVPVATVSETTAGHLCDVDDNGLDLFCGGNNPQLMANGGISSTSISNTVINFEGVTATSVLGAGGNFIVSGTTSVSASNAGTIKFATAGSERMVIDGTGNVGIGEISPTAELEVPGTISATGISTASLTVNGTPVTGGGDSGLGNGQSYVNNMNNRNIGTQYNNNTGRAIWVTASVVGQNFENYSVNLFVDGNRITTSSHSLNTDGAVRATVNGIVPAGSNYEIDVDGGSVNLVEWWELR